MLFMKPPREIEAKYAVADAGLLVQLMSLPAIGPFALHAAPAPELQHNIYYDTRDWRLRSVLHSFRIRSVGGRFIATLKGPAIVDGATTSRAELEIAVPEAHPEALPPGELRDQLVALTSGAALHPTLTIMTTRQIMHALRDAAPALEIALDDVTLLADGRRSGAFQELEIELLPAGSPEDLARLARLLTERFPLTPQPLSKLARGLAFLEATE
jgi:triphosphatase